MNKKKTEFDKIDVQYSENIIINIKPVTETLIKEELPGYVNETYSNTFNSSELCWNCCHSFNCCSKGIPLKYTNNIFYIYGHFCSYNCCARYIFDMIHDKKKWDIYQKRTRYMKR